MFFVCLEAVRNVSLDCGSSLFMNCLLTNFHCLLGLLQMDTDYWFLSDVSVGITDIWKNDSILLQMNLIGLICRFPNNQGMIHTMHYIHIYTHH
jgi:hypothetical protein